MKKYLILLFSFFVMAGNLFYTVNANVADKIRVGLESKFKSVDSVQIQNKKIYVGYGGKFSDYAFEAQKNFSIAVAKKFYIDSGKKFSSYSEALTQKNNYVKNGQPAIICACGANSWGIYFGEYNDLQAAQLANKKISGKIIPPSEKKLSLAADEKPFLILDDCPQFKSNEFINLAGKNYRGVIEFGFYGAEKITVVNILSVNEYLYGVVPAEMPSSWPEEALKAQAIAARTYAMKNLGAHKFYDLCDTTHCQSYSGVNGESERVNKFIDETRDICIYHKNKLISAVFFSNSGGCTEASENVWGGVIEYLKSVKEINEEEKVWEREISFAEIEKILAEKKINIGELLGVEILKTLPSGRVGELAIVGTDGEKILTREEIRNFFAKTKDGILKSRMFSVTNYSAPENKIKISGRGSGHGVGMSQYGAKGMAQLGYKYEDILKYYYSGVELR